MYYLYPSVGYQFVDYIALSPVTHLSVIDTDTGVHRTLCGHIYKRATGLPYARHTCDMCMMRGIYERAVRPGLLPYALTIQLEPWAGTWVGEMLDDINPEILGADAEGAVGPFTSLDNAWWYVRHELYNQPSVLPGDVPGMRLAQELGTLAATYPLATADIRFRPGGAQISLELTPDAPDGTLVKVFRELNIAALHIGFGTLRVPVDPMNGTWRMTDTAASFVFSYPPNWSMVVREQDESYAARAVNARLAADTPRLQSKEMSL